MSTTHWRHAANVSWHHHDEHGPLEIIVLLQLLCLIVENVPVTIGGFDGSVVKLCFKSIGLCMT